MDKRMVEFIRALRAAGVRISLAESQDATYGVNLVGVGNRDHFRSTMKTTLVKESRDHPIFEYFFPLFFGSNTPPLQNIPENMSSEDRQMLQEALRALMGQMAALRQLLNQLMEGKPFSQEQLDQMGQQSGLDSASDMYQRPWFERRMNRQAGLQQLQQMLEQLLEQLRANGRASRRFKNCARMMQENMQKLSEQISQHVGATGRADGRAAECVSLTCWMCPSRGWAMGSRSDTAKKSGGWQQCAAGRAAPEEDTSRVLPTARKTIAPTCATTVCLSS
jgi:uncharacterized protein with von Willebrand factor type A (vWA) domain